MNQLPKRRKNRLENINYTETGIYFITMCSKDKKCIFSNVYPGADDSLPPVIKPTKTGLIAEEAIIGVTDHYENASVINYVIMPNHIHLLLALNNTGGRMISAPTVIGSLKRFASRQAKSDIWQKGFYDHVIRDDEDLKIKWDNIEGNPAQWLLNKDEYSE